MASRDVRLPGPTIGGTNVERAHYLSGGDAVHVVGGVEQFALAPSMLTAPTVGALAAARAALKPVPSSVRNIASSTNTNPIVIATLTPHGRATGDLVSVGGHATNTNANGALRAVTVLSATTFSIVVAGNGVGGATGIVGLTSELTACQWQARDGSSPSVVLTDGYGNTATWATLGAGEGCALGLVDITAAGVVAVFWDR